jgi:hypothetical protein
MPSQSLPPPMPFRAAPLLTIPHHRRQPSQAQPVQALPHRCSPDRAMPRQAMATRGVPPRVMPCHPTPQVAPCLANPGRSKPSRLDPSHTTGGSRAVPCHAMASRRRASQSIPRRPHACHCTALHTACHAEAPQAAQLRTTPHSHYFFNDFRFDANLRCHTSEHLPQQNRAVHCRPMIGFPHCRQGPATFMVVAWMGLELLDDP